MRLLGRAHARGLLTVLTAGLVTGMPSAHAQRRPRVGVRWRADVRSRRLVHRGDEILPAWPRSRGLAVQGSAAERPKLGDHLVYYATYFVSTAVALATPAARASCAVPANERCSSRAGAEDVGGGVAEGQGDAGNGNAGRDGWPNELGDGAWPAVTSQQRGRSLAPL